MKLHEIFHRLEPQKAKLNKIIFIVPDPETQILNEATRKTVGNFTARRDQPHFDGDQYHAHVDLPKGYEVAWNKDGSRRHEGKFPAIIPKDTMAAAANVLGVHQDILESFRWHDPVIDEDVYIIEFKKIRGSGERAIPPGWI